VSQKIDHNEMKLESIRNRDAELNEGSDQGIHQAAGEMVAQDFSQNKDFQAGLIKATFPLQILIR
jgi:hypothetical protein